MQQLFRLLIFLIQAYVIRATNSPILRSTFWLYIQLLVQCTDTAADRYIVPTAVYTVKKCSWGWENLSPETCRPELKRLINEKVVASCWLFTSLYISLSLLWNYADLCHTAGATNMHASRDRSNVVSDTMALRLNTEDCAMIILV
jgi:hypothetical protein